MKRSESLLRPDVLRAILAEATVSFLGFGIAPSTPTRGHLLVGAQHYVYAAPWLVVAPGVAIPATLLWLHALGGLVSSPPGGAGHAPSSSGSATMRV